MSSTSYKRNLKRTVAFRSRGWSYQRIADRIGVSTPMVNQYLAAAGMVKQRGRRKVTVEMVNEAYEHGHRSQQDMADALGCSLATAKARAKEAGIEFQGRRNRRKEHATTVARSFLRNGRPARIDHALKRVAEEVGITPQWARQYLVDLGLLASQDDEREALYRTIKLLSEKTELTTTEIAKGLKICRTTVWKATKKDEKPAQAGPEGQEQGGSGVRPRPNEPNTGAESAEEEEA